MGIEWNGQLPKIDVTKLPDGNMPTFITPKYEIDIGRILGDGSKGSFIKGLGIEKPEPTQENLDAKAALDQKVSSTGIKYADAKKTINNIREKYNDDKYYTEVTVHHKQPDNIGIYYPPTKERKFSPDKLPEPAKTQYFEALESVREIEDSNSALLKQAGISATETPRDPQVFPSDRIKLY